MSDDWKYIKFKDKTVVVFPPHISHDDIRIRGCGEPVNAGFVSFGVGEDGKTGFGCYGRSETLKLESDSNDEKIINKIFRDFDFNFNDEV